MSLAERYEYQVVTCPLDIHLSRGHDDLNVFMKSVNHFGEEGFRFISSFLVKDGFILLFSRPIKEFYVPTLDEEKKKKLGNSMMY